MWCSNCQQDVPALPQPASGKSICARCHKVLQHSQSVRLCDEGLELDDESTVATIGEAPPVAIDDWEIRRRTRELGVRKALGARPADVLRLVLTDGARLVLPGLALGLVGAAAAARLLGSQLHGVGPGDPLSYVVAAAVLALAAFLASWLPGRRAARVDPMVALRSE